MLRLIEKERITAATYATFIRAHRGAIQRILASHSQKADGKDPFEIRAALKDLITALEAKNVDALATAHNAINERLDAHLTMLVRR